MNGLDTIIRDNLKWQARAWVAAAQRGQDARVVAIGAAILAEPRTSPIARLAAELLVDASAERRATRGL